MDLKPLYTKEKINESISIINKNLIPLNLDLILVLMVLLLDKGSTEVLDNSNLLINATK